MSISIQCPECEKKLKAKDESAGKRVKCPGCGESIPVPVVQQVAADKPSSPLAGKLPATRKTEPKAAHPPHSEPKLARWPWYVGGIAGLCLVATVVVIFAMPDSRRIPATTELADGSMPEAKPESKSEAKPEPNSDLDRLADRLAAYQMLEATLGKQLKDTAIMHVAAAADRTFDEKLAWGIFLACFERAEKQNVASMLKVLQLSNEAATLDDVKAFIKHQASLASLKTSD